jgi:protein gp37
VGDNSKIEWTDATWNPVTGCTKVSPGCDHCYAERVTERFSGPGSFARIVLHEDRLGLPLRWRKPRRVFVNSMSDLFHERIPDEYVARVFAVMAVAPEHTFQVLTKRHGRMRSLLRSEPFRQQVMGAARRGPEAPLLFPSHIDGGGLQQIDWPLPNVHLGVSVEDQKWADIRIPALLETPAAVRFLSCEPLLGPVDLTGSGTAQMYWLTGRPEWGPPDPDGLRPLTVAPVIDWVIAGGESGQKARPMHPAWARDLRDQCQAAGVPYLFKQWGEWAPVEPDEGWNRRQADWLIRHDGYSWPLTEPHGAEDATTATIRRVGKHAAGRLLDGRTWDEYPERVSA